MCVCLCIFKERNGNRQMSVRLLATGSVPAARLTLLRTKVCARGRPECTAVPVGCQAAELVVKKLQCWFGLAFRPCSQTISHSALFTEWIRRLMYTRMY